MTSPWHEIVGPEIVDLTRRARIRLTDRQQDRLYHFAGGHLLDAVATEPAIFVVLIAEPDRDKKMLDVIKPG